MRILVIKLSAFGDVCLYLGVFERIRAQHPHAHITLMTTAPYDLLCAKNPCFDHIETVSRWRWHEITGWIGFFYRIHVAPFDVVYDLQGNDRTSILRALSPPAMRKKWVSKRRRLAVVKAADMMDTDPEFLPQPQNLEWLDGDVSRFLTQTGERFALVTPGSAPKHLGKRWPAAYYAALCCKLVAGGITPVLIGTRHEEAILAGIAKACPEAVNLCGQTSFGEIAALARRAAVAIGNDTGPMHLISLCGCPVVSIFSPLTDARKSAPRGDCVRVLSAENLDDLGTEHVLYTAISIARAPLQMRESTTGAASGTATVVRHIFS